MMYEVLVKKIVEAYTTIGFRPQPRVWIDKERKVCGPLVALAIRKEGHEKFMSMGGQFYSDSALRRYITDVMFKRNWSWVYAFVHAFDLSPIVKSWWEHMDTYRAGYRAGRHVRRCLKEIYYRKKGPKNAEEIESALSTTFEGGAEEDVEGG